LAIELAAARVRALPVVEIARRLDDRFRLLTGGSRTAQPRQQTLRAVVDWSHELLDEGEKHVLARLSAFVGGFTLDDAAEVVGGDKIDVADVGGYVLRLVDKSLVTPDTERGRFGLLQTLWLYARERLVASGDDGLVRERHARHFAKMAERLEPDLRGPAQRQALDQLAREHDNLATALDWAVDAGDKELGARLVSALGWFWYVHSHVAAGARWTATVSALPGQLDPILEARMLRYEVLLGMFAGRPDVPSADAVLALAREADAPSQLAETLIVAAAAYPRHGDAAFTTAALEEAAAIGRAVGDHWVQGTAALLAAGVLGGVQEHKKIEVATESVEHFRTCGDDWGLSMALMTRALSLEARGDYDAALGDYADAHLAAERLGGGELSQHFEVHHANLRTLTGDAVSARRQLERAIVAVRRGGYTGVLGMALNGLGLACRRVGDLEAAAAAHAEARDLYLSGKWLAGAALAHAGLGFVAEQAGTADIAERHHLESLELARRYDDERAVALACEGLAGVAALRSDHDRAARLLGHAAHRRAGAAAPLPAGERIDVDRIEASVIGAIGRDRFDALAAEGSESELDALLSR
jgi:tetratricopeptide (TPR) repeat protein